MTTATKNIIKSAIELDPSLTADERETAKALLHGGRPSRSAATDLPRVVTFKDAAAQLGVTVQRVYQLVKAGSLRKARIKGNSRASGVYWDSLATALV